DLELTLDVDAGVLQGLGVDLGDDLVGVVGLGPDDDVARILAGGAVVLGFLQRVAGAAGCQGQCGSSGGQGRPSPRAAGLGHRVPSVEVLVPSLPCSPAARSARRARIAKIASTTTASATIA